MSDDPAPRGTIGALAALLALGAAAFYPVLFNGFVNFDDVLFIRDNPDFNPVTLGALLRYWRGPYFGGAFPLTYLFLGTVASLAQTEDGLNPFAFRLAGLLVHLGGAVAVFFIVRMLLRSTLAALLGAAVFCVHPLQVEAAAWAVSPYTTLSLVTVALYVRYAQLSKDTQDAQLSKSPTIAPRDPATQRRLRLFYVAATVCFVLAMLAKPVAMVVVFIAAAIDVGWVRRRSVDVARALVPWCVLIIPFVIMTRAMIRTPPVVAPPLWERPLVAMDGLAFYLVKLIWPVGLVPDYGRTPQWLREHGPFWTAWLLPAAVGVIVALRWRSDRRPAALFALFTLSFLPVLGLLPHHFQAYSTVADRYAYLPLLAVAIAVGWCVAARPRLAYAIVPLIVVATVLSNIQSRRWRDTQTLFDYTLRLNPDSFAAHRILGYEARLRGDNVLASAHYTAALALRPDDATTNFNFAGVLVDRGEIGSALARYERALVQKPDDPQIRNNYGVALARAGRWDEAAEQFNAVLARYPDDAGATRNLAIVHATRPALPNPASRPAPQSPVPQAPAP